MSTTLPDLLSKRLTILKYPKPQYINLEEREEFINVVIYLLETYLSKSSSSVGEESTLDLQLVSVTDTWEDSFKKYLNENHCTLKIDNLLILEQKQQALEWLTTLAIKSSYKDNSDQIHETKYKCLQKLKLQLLSFDSTPEDLKAAIIKLATLFNIPISDSLTQMLHAIVRIAERKFTSNIVGNLKSSTSGVPTTKTTTTTTTTTTITNTTKATTEDKEYIKTINTEIVNNNIYPLGFDLQNEKMNSVATILRLLYVSDLREIQSKINQVLAIVQNYSADPQTNFKLGVVGR
ncbi:hypothetical protein PPL_00682 [Heterostelium album PN500]|uniref:Uncharacterized protein n=1 Tax=Heterostelium pallidum (strain ATCC 26659 / Pp 5 / PN500) TaxID=670386 RepID=D3AX53_HETP5|nr:hypothetical protein PPL_00682 [Heterostelium album PN500]EFA86122.1 hypothetical protein PPL_00682 [Heterostelium album PN500]|eukprot:XP_020438227.1 hypothetical protein PPL_00682 [Heterostelium album PN500]